MTHFFKHKETGEIKPYDEISKGWTIGATTHEEANRMLKEGKERFNNDYEPVSEFHPSLAPFETTDTLTKSSGIIKPIFVVSDEFLIANWMDHAIWKGCPHIINENVINCIQELKDAGQFPYNNTVGELYCKKNGIDNYVEHSLLSAVVYCCQGELSNRIEAEHEVKMLSDGWLILNVDIVKTAIDNKKKLIIYGKKDNDFLSSNISKEKPYRPIIDCKGQYFLIAPGKSRSGYYLQNLMKPFSSNSIFCKFSN